MSVMKEKVKLLLKYRMRLIDVMIKRIRIMRKKYDLERDLHI